MKTDRNQKIQQKLSFLEEKRLKIAQRHKKYLPYYAISLVIGLLFGILMKSGGAALFTGGLTALFIFLIHFANVLEPFRFIKNAFKEALLNEYMATYHPDIHYDYYPEQQQGKAIIKKSGLISADRYEEEDVIKGAFNDVTFYLSEVKLKNKSNNSNRTIFKGMLFQLDIPEAQWPNSQIQSQPNLLRMFFKGFLYYKKYGFWFETNNKPEFEEKLNSLFPFIQHLIKNQGDIRISTYKDKITILIESKSKFLDEPRPSINHTFLDKTYYKNIVKQLNSLLFIVKAFAQNLGANEIEDQLELKVLEFARNFENQ